MRFSRSSMRAFVAASGWLEAVWAGAGAASRASGAAAGGAADAVVVAAGGGGGGMDATFFWQATLRTAASVRAVRVRACDFIDILLEKIVTSQHRQNRPDAPSLAYSIFR